MTINSFYKVVVTPKTVTVREMANVRESGDGYTGTETPNDFDPFDGPAQADRGCCL